MRQWLKTKLRRLKNSIRHIAENGVLPGRQTLIDIEYGHGTHVGLRREHNEDAYCVEPDLSLWLVADGMGGHEHGEIASAIARDTVRDIVSKGESLETAILAADNAILNHSIENNDALPMGTTVVAAQLAGDRYDIAWIGDSRIYHYNDSLKQISRDHSYVQELIDQGAISPDQARKHPQRNVVTQALGVTHPDHLQIETCTGSLQPGDQLLLCSDGLTEEVDDEAISRILAESTNPQDSVDKLILASLDNGGSDNITVVLIQRRS